MKNKIFLITLFFYLFSCIGNQTKERKEKEKQNRFINFEISQISQQNKDENLQLIIKIPVNKLVFEKKHQFFESSVTIDVLINDLNNKIVYSNSWDEKIKKNFYDDTKSHEIIYLSHEFYLETGQYDLNMLINDFENHINWIKKSDFLVKENFGLSDLSILFKENNIYKPYSKEYNINDIDTLWVAFQINDSNISDLEFYYLFINAEHSKDYIFNNDRQEKFDILIFKEENVKDNDLSKIVFEDNIIYNKLIMNRVKYIPIPIISEYFNILEITMTHKDEIRYELLNFFDQKEYQYDYSILFGPMYYLLQSEYYEFEKLSYEQKWNYVKEYWEDIRNNNKDNGGRLKEFYKRVIYVNNKFKFLTKKGWKTDRGRIYVIYGAPHNIDHEFNEQGEFEIWTYKNNKKYIFINRFGSYELYTQT